MRGHDAEPGGGSASEASKVHLREIDRVTVSTLIISGDGSLLLGQRNSARGGSHPHRWHIPGGEVEEGESSAEAALRKTHQEVGLRFTQEQLIAVPFVGEGESVRTLDSGETVWCRMKLVRFELHLDRTVDELDEEATPGGDLFALRWFSPEELLDIEQVTGGKEFLIRAGYIGGGNATRTRIPRS